jgi:hypothetical protein
VSFRETEISPHQIWASQDSLEDSRVEMVRAAINYMNNVGKPIPPVAVWYNKYDSHYRYVAHDGHHRIYICAEMGIAVPAVLMEYWLDNPDDPILAKKMMFLQLNCLVVHLPISQFCSI